MTWDWAAGSHRASSNLTIVLGKFRSISCIISLWGLHWGQFCLDRNPLLYELFSYLLSSFCMNQLCVFFFFFLSSESRKWHGFMRSLQIPCTKPTPSWPSVSICPRGWGRKRKVNPSRASAGTKCAAGAGARAPGHKRAHITNVTSQPCQSSEKSPAYS